MTRIEIADDHYEGAAFVAWLNANGYDAELGNTTGNYVDGRWTAVSDSADDLLRDLWDEYCNA